MTTRPCETRAFSPSWCWARKARMWDSWISAKSKSPSRPRFGLHDTAGEEVHAVLTGPARRTQTATAVPEPPPQTGGVGLHPVREHLEALDTAEVRRALAPHEVQQAPHPLVGEVLGLGRVRVQRLLHLLVVHRRADADTRVDPAPGQDVDRCQVLGQAQRVLPAERDDRGAQLDTAGALRGRCHHRDGGGDAVLEMTMPQPRAVEAEPLTQFDDLQRGLVPPARIRLVEQADGQETQLAQGA